MDVAIDNTVSTALAMQQMQTAQEAQMLVLRKTLDAQASAVVNLVDSIPKLSTEGLVGRNIHTTA